MRGRKPGVVDTTSSSNASFFGLQVERPAADLRGSRSPLEVGSSMVILLPAIGRVQEVQRVARRALVPAHVLRFAVARQDADHRGQAAIPLPHGLAGLQPLEARGARDDRDEDVLLRDGDVVDDSEIRRLAATPLS